MWCEPNHRRFQNKVQRRKEKSKVTGPESGKRRCLYPKWNQRHTYLEPCSIFSLKSAFSSLFLLYNFSMAITRRQKEVLDFLNEFTRRNGYSPSYEEIAHGLGLKSLATVHKHVTNLVNKGQIRRDHNRSRSIDVLPQRSQTRSGDHIPLMGQIAAGQLIEGNENPDTLTFGDIVGNRDAFALKVQGDSMRDEHIVNGDFVLVERTSVAHEGEIVVALVQGAETTLKRYYVEGPNVRLQPSNSEMDPIFVPRSQLSIQGKVLGLIRKIR